MFSLRAHNKHVQAAKKKKEIQYGIVVFGDNRIGGLVLGPSHHSTRTCLQRVKFVLSVLQGGLDFFAESQSDEITLLR